MNFYYLKVFRIIKETPISMCVHLPNSSHSVWLLKSQIRNVVYDNSDKAVGVVITEAMVMSGIIEEERFSLIPWVCLPSQQNMVGYEEK